MIYFLHKDSESHPIVIVFPKVSITTNDFMKASEGKKTYLLFLNVGYFDQSSNGGEWNYIYGVASSKGVKGDCVLGYNEAKDDLSYQNCCLCNASFFFAFVVMIIVFSSGALVGTQ
jgi:hypothetical protein